MEEVVNNIIELIKQEASNNNPLLVLFLGSLIIIIESIIPILPLALFIALNMLIFGNIWGFIISFISTIIGCTISFYIFRLGFNKYIYKFIENKDMPKKLINKIDKIKFKHFVLITALPFAPAFAINIASGMSEMSYKKFLTNIIISKISVVYFWGYIGKSFLESITDINTLIKLGIILVIAYYISNYITKKLNIE
jgi:uncharacterized membrane protein YdjX (TVP38/TMEM64 family)